MYQPHTELFLSPKEEHTLQLLLFFTLVPFRRFSFCLFTSLTLPSFRPVSLVTRLFSPSCHLSHRCITGPALTQSFSVLFSGGLNSPVSGSPARSLMDTRPRRQRAFNIQQMAGARRNLPMSPSPGTTQKPSNIRGSALTPPFVTPINQIHYLLLLNYDSSLRSAEKPHQ